MNADGWLMSVLMCATSFLPALGARTSTARRRLLVAGAVVSLVIGSLALAAAANPSEGFFPSSAGWAFLLIGIPLGAGIAAAGLTLVLTRPTRLSTPVRSVLAITAFAATPAYVIWRLVW